VSGAVRIIHETVASDTNFAAIWSAVAATFSAASALVMVLIHRRNMLDAARPELVITGWKITTKKDHEQKTYEVIGFDKVRNVGKGAALGAVVKCNLVLEKDELAIGGPSLMLPIMAAGDEHDVSDGSVQFEIHWHRLKSDLHSTHLHVELLSHDAQGIRHSTIYYLLVFGSKDARLVSHVHQLARGIVFVARYTITEPYWRWRLRHRLSHEWKNATKRVRI
jgi:hypothetical protein